MHPVIRGERLKKNGLKFLAFFLQILRRSLEDESSPTPIHSLPSFHPSPSALQLIYLSSEKSRIWPVETHCYPETGSSIALCETKLVSEWGLSDESRNTWQGWVWLQPQRTQPNFYWSTNNCQHSEPWTVPTAMDGLKCQKWDVERGEVACAWAPPADLLLVRAPGWGHKKYFCFSWTSDYFTILLYSRLVISGEIFHPCRSALWKRNTLFIRTTSSPLLIK